MSWYQTSEPVTRDLLIGFYDLTNYVRFCRDHDDEHVLRLMQGYFRLTGGIVADAKGVLIKTIGDAGFAAFQAEECDQGIRAFLRLKEEGDAWLAKNDMQGKAVVKLHLGSVACGMVGTRGREIFGVYGKTVNTTALLESRGFSMSQQVFRALSPETRQLFKKHTPPITYIPQDQGH